MGCLDEFDMDEYKEMLRQETYEEAFEEGKKRGQWDGEKRVILRMLQTGKTPESIAEFSGYPLEFVKQVAEENQ